MPRLTRLKTENQYSKLVENIRLYQLKRSDAGDNCFESAQRLGIPYRTLANRLKKAGSFHAPRTPKRCEHVECVDSNAPRRIA